ncbi:MAG: hypothetical protein LJE83_14565 [Gammaproteobacteria bacterium]|nr:hypothetical protein [Gammaproteobacteria bacterium]
MSDNDDLNAFYCLEITPKLSAKEERLARIREHQRRERKVNLYSYPATAKSRDTLS